MPKSQYVDPKEIRKAGEITFKPIPVNQYNKSVKDELKAKNFTEEELKNIYHDMVVIREFETMLNLVKTTGAYNGIAYNNPGPAHLSAGQEAAAVGMAYTLTTDDFIFGSHRSHGEILAKGLRSIALLSDAELEKIMKGEGRIDAFKPAEGLKEFLLGVKSCGIKIGLATSGLDYKAIPEIVAAFRTLRMGDPLAFYDSVITGAK